MAKRGRNRKSGSRHACGKLVQARPEERADKVRAVGINARQRQFGLTEAQASSEHAGTVLGRLWLRHIITEEMRDAGYRYWSRVRAYRKAIRVRGVSSGGDLERGAGHEGDADPTPEEIADYEAAIERHRQYRDALLNAGMLCLLVVDAVVLEGKDMPSHRGDLMAGLKALVDVRAARRKAA